MGCSNCGSATLGGKPAGCRSNGSCLTGGCNRLNTYDWLASVPIPEDQLFRVVEVSFKHGSRKDFFRNSSRLDVLTGDLVVVESEGGYDVGRISLSGELVKLQLKKRRTADRRRRDMPRVLRKAREKDLENLTEARAREGAVMIRARKMVQEAGIQMKIADVEFQGDLRKATFYYTADERVDFRDLIRQFAQEFRIKVDMRQIGARQEAGKLGGIGACGRELCCSTWLTEFQSVSTSAARYQNLAINQSKLSGQCGRLKCCLNYELETYVEGMKAFPKGAKRLKTVDGEAVLQKSDLFRVLMYYSIPSTESMEQFALHPDQVREILALNEQGELAPALGGLAVPDVTEAPVEVEFVENAQVSLRTLERSSRRRRSGKNRDNNRGNNRDGQRGNSGDSGRNKDNRQREARDNSSKDNRNKRNNREGREAGDDAENQKARNNGGNPENRVNREGRRGGRQRNTDRNPGNGHPSQGNPSQGNLNQSNRNQGNRRPGRDRQREAKSDKEQQADDRPAGERPGDARSSKRRRGRSGRGGSGQGRSGSEGQPDGGTE